MGCLTSLFDHPHPNVSTLRSASLCVFGQHARSCGSCDGFAVYITLRLFEACLEFTVMQRRHVEPYGTLVWEEEERHVSQTLSAPTTVGPSDEQLPRGRMTANQVKLSRS